MAFNHSYVTVTIQNLFSHDAENCICVDIHDVKKITFIIMVNAL